MFKTRRKRKEFVGRRQQYRRVRQAVNKILIANVSDRTPYNNLNSLNEMYNNISNNLDTNRVENNNIENNNNENLDNVIVSPNLQYDNDFIIDR